MARDVDGSPLEWRYEDSREQFFRHGDRLLVKRLKASGFTPEQIDDILICVSRTCKYCWDDEQYECCCQAHE
jgi:hypothetical protein